MAEHASTSEILRSPIINTWLLLLALTGAVVSALYYAHSLNNLVITENKRENTLVLARELRQTSDDLTRMVRTYIVTGNSIYKRHFQEILDIRDGKAPRPVGLGRVYWDLVGPDDRRPRPSGPPAALLDLMRESGIMASEFAILQRSKEASDLLTRTEFAAMALVESDPSPAARLRAIQMLTDRAYHQAKAVIMSGIATFEEQISQRTLNNLEKAETTREYAIGLLAVTCVLSVFLLWRQLYSLNLERRLYQMGQSLLESEERFHLMTDEIKDYAIILLDLEGRVTSWNTGAERIKGYTDQEILGQSMTVFYPQEGVLSGKPHTLLQQAKDEGQAKDTGWRVRKDGSRFYADVTITAVHDRSGKFIGFAKITHDITESRQAQQELLAAKEAAEAASRAKSEFLANMSHEVRTPMNGVIGMSEVLLNTRLTDEQRRMMQVIRDSAQAQLGILNDILDFSKIEAGKLSFSIEPFVFADLVEKTCAALAEPARQKRVALRHDVDADIPRALEGDALRVRQILANFLSNAIKFSSGLERTGEVEVMARLANEGSGQVWVELAVRDNGIGMDTATLARVFQPFTQADASTTRQYGGTGLGLVISTRLVEMMGGEIRVESTPDIGSTFTARLPFPRADEARLAATTEAMDRPLPQVSAPSREAAIQQEQLILVAEDNETNQEVIQQQLTLLGYRCDVAPDGRAAFNQWQTGDYGLVLSDLHMPQMDGYQLAQAIRAEEEKRGADRTPILALTANVLKGEAERCQAAGMDGYLAKPVPLSQLREQLVHWLPAVVDANPADTTTEAPVHAEVLEEGGELPVFDPGALTGMVGDKPAIHRRLIEKFLANAQAQAERLRAALVEGNTATVGQIAHGLKSNARAVGALQLGSLCEQMEQAGKAADGDRCRALDRRLSAALNEVARTLRS